MKFLFFGASKPTDAPPEEQQQPTVEESTAQRMATLPKIAPNGEKNQIKADVSMRKEAEKISSTKPSTKLDPKLVPEVPKLNVNEIPAIIAPDPHELEEAESEFVNHFSREFKNLRNFIAEEAPEIQLNLKAHSPYIIGAMIAAPACTMYSNMRKNGLIDFVHKTSTRSKFIQLMIMGAGIAAYQYNKPQIKKKFLKDFKDA